MNQANMQTETAFAAGSRKPSGSLDPFAEYRRGEHVLRERLDAADETRLRAIIRGHHWIDEHKIDLGNIRHVVLEEMIIAAVRRRSAPDTGE